MKIDKILLFPYAVVLALRNLLYDRGIIKSWEPSLPTLCVGNVTVGGTGKTPMVELLVRLYKDSRRVAVVSRGYGRRTKGFRTVSVEDSYRDVGDEPLKVKRKFPDLSVPPHTSAFFHIADECSSSGVQGLPAAHRPAPGSSLADAQSRYGCCYQGRRGGDRYGPPQLERFAGAQKKYSAAFLKDSLYVPGSCFPRGLRSALPLF